MAGSNPGDEIFAWKLVGIMFVVCIFGVGKLLFKKVGNRKRFRLLARTGAAWRFRRKNHQSGKGFHFLALMRDDLTKFSKLFQLFILKRTDLRCARSARIFWSTRALRARFYLHYRANRLVKTWIAVWKCDILLLFTTFL